MSLTINTKTFANDTGTGNAYSYFGPAKTASLKDDLSLKRTAPKKTSVFSGLSRTEAKFTRTLALTGSLTGTGDAIVTINVSVPVGYTASDVDALLDDTGSFLAGADFKTHVKATKINF